MSNNVSFRNTYLLSSINMTVEEFVDNETKKIINKYELQKIKREVSLSCIEYLENNQLNKKMNQCKRIGDGLNKELSFLIEEYDLYSICYSKDERHTFNNYVLSINKSDIPSEDRTLFKLSDSVNTLIEKEQLEVIKKNLGEEVVVPSYDEVYEDLIGLYEDTKKLMEFLNNNFKSKYLNQVFYSNTEFMNIFVSKITEEYRKNKDRKQDIKKVEFTRI